MKNRNVRKTQVFFYASVNGSYVVEREWEWKRITWLKLMNSPDFDNNFCVKPCTSTLKAILSVKRFYILIYLHLSKYSNNEGQIFFFSKGFKEESSYSCYYPGLFEIYFSARDKFDFSFIYTCTCTIKHFFHRPQPDKAQHCMCSPQTCLWCISNKGKKLWKNKHAWKCNFVTVNIFRLCLKSERQSSKFNKIQVRNNCDTSQYVHLYQLTNKIIFSQKWKKRIVLKTEQFRWCTVGVIIE